METNQPTMMSPIEQLIYDIAMNSSRLRTQSKVLIEKIQGISKEQECNEEIKVPLGIMGQLKEIEKVLEEAHKNFGQSLEIM